MRYDGVNAVSFGDPEARWIRRFNWQRDARDGGFFGARRNRGGQRHHVSCGSWTATSSSTTAGRAAASTKTFANFAEVATHELGHVLGLATRPTSRHHVRDRAFRRPRRGAQGRRPRPACAPISGSPPPPLTLAFSAPANGTTVSGTTPVSLSAAAAWRYGYQVWLDGASLASSASFSWNTRRPSSTARTPCRPR